MVNAVDQRFQEELIDRCLTTVPLTEEIDGSKIMISGGTSCKSLMYNLYYPPRVPNYIRHRKLFGFPTFSHPYSFSHFHLYAFIIILINLRSCAVIYQHLPPTTFINPHIPSSTFNLVHFPSLTLIHVH